MLHQKSSSSTAFGSLVGSSNLDDRSYDINDEASVGIIDRGVAAQLKNAFDDDPEKLNPGPARGLERPQPLAQSRGLAQLSVNDQL